VITLKDIKVVFGKGKVFLDRERAAASRQWILKDTGNEARTRGR
jgi:hypothetical protein